MPVRPPSAGDRKARPVDDNVCKLEIPSAPPPTQLQRTDSSPVLVDVPGNRGGNRYRLSALPYTGARDALLCHRERHPTNCQSLRSSMSRLRFASVTPFSANSLIPE